MSRIPHTRMNRAARRNRRGNSIVLVSALLVLLVIIAAAYVTRTNATRGTASAIRTAELRDAKAEVVRDAVAQHIADALFVAPVQPIHGRAINHSFDFPGAAQPTLAADANAPRLDVSLFDTFFGTDQPTGRYNVDFRYPYNYAPHHVVPYTNWPDAMTLEIKLGGLNFNAGLWPAGPGNPGGGAGASALDHEGNPVGNPGFGDTRWLRDAEPLRIDTNDDGVLDAFSHWRHLSYLATPNNGFRVCRDISDITDFDGNGVGGLVEDLNIPIEQWLATPLNSWTASTGDTVFETAAMVGMPNDFDNWIFISGPIPGAPEPALARYQNRYTDPAQIPGNLYRLRDLDADGTFHELPAPGDFPQETPDAEFIQGTARNQVSRFLTDTDGDGYTDAFWHLLPLPVQDGIRYIGAFSIIDNSANINANVATRFQKWDDETYPQGGYTGLNSRTRGHGPADIALTSQLAPGDMWNNWNVGFYDSPLNDGIPAFTGVPFDYLPNRWLYHVERTGLPAGVLDQFQRLDYYKRAGLNPMNPLNPTDFDSTYAYYQPFSLADELELRMYYGQNYEWIVSRYEFSAQHPIADTIGFVRANQSGLAETTEIGSQLVNRALVKDPRHRITMYSNTRNELLPPWLQYRWARFPGNEDSHDADGPDNNLLDRTWPEEIRQDKDSGAYPLWLINDNFVAQQTLKLDLREPNVVRDNTTAAPSYLQFNPGWDPVNGVANDGPGLMTFAERLPIALMHALDDGPRLDVASNTFNGKTYFGTYSYPYSLAPQPAPGPFDPDATNPLERTRALSASYAANILAYRSADTNLYLQDDLTTPAVEGPIKLPDLPDIPAPDESHFLGMEMQPFLLEAFFGHVYEAVEVPAQATNGTIFTNEGNYVVLHHNDRHTPVIAVQIANPYDRPILLWDGTQSAYTDRIQYQIEIFGEKFNLDSMHILPAPGDPPPAPDDPIFMPPSTPEQPSTVIFFAMPDGDVTEQQQWRDFLDIEHDELPPNTIIYDISDQLPDNRGDYENTPTDVEAIALYRHVRDPNGVDPAVDVLIDRIDQPTGSSSEEFKETFDDLQQPEPMQAPSNDPANWDGAFPPESPYQAPEWDMGPDFTHWVQWVRATRAWGVDLDANDLYEQDERNPRYVFGHKAVITAARSEYESINGAFPADDSFWIGASGEARTHGGNRFNPQPGVDPDDTDGAGKPWFRRDYYSIFPDPGDATAPFQAIKRTGKPTFFPMRNTILDPMSPNNVLFPVTINDPTDAPGTNPGYLPDKGWYGQVESNSDNLQDPITETDVTNNPAEYTLEDIGDYPMFLDNGFPRAIHNFAMQMLQKDGDFEQVGELLNVWLWGHLLDMTPSGAPGVPPTYNETVRTFTEFMAEDLDDAPNDFLRRAQVNRLSLGEEMLGSADVPVNNPTDVDYTSVQNAVPNLPAGLRVLDLFVCDSYGSNLLDYDGNGTLDANDYEVANRNLRFNNANGFTGRPVFGQINLNTSFPEVMQSLPHMFRAVHGEYGYTARTFLPEAIVQYRERYDGELVDAAGLPKVYGFKNLIDTNGDGTNEDIGAGPDYSDRDGLFSELRTARGLASASEVLLMDRPAFNGVAPVDNNRWRAGFAGMNPNVRRTDLNRTTNRLSTDVVDDYRYDILNFDPGRSWDRTASDSEELNMLYSGMSNMVTTRSDTFTVYMRIRAFKQNPVSGRWDATDPEYIVDDSRYVMLVDRSNVNRPGDKPKILYFEKLPK